MEKLIIVRGPCGSGKSTVAKKLLELVEEPTVLIARDQYRFMFSGQWDQRDPSAEQEMIEDNILTGLKHHYDVIVEGIFSMNTHRPMFNRLFRDHPEENHVFYMDVPFDETLRRHNSRPQKTAFGEKEMKGWWSYASPMGREGEVMIPESSSMDETIKTIGKIANLKLKPA